MDRNARISALDGVFRRHRDTLAFSVVGAASPPSSTRAANSWPFRADQSPGLRLRTALLRVRGINSDEQDCILQDRILDVVFPEPIFSHLRPGIGDPATTYRTVIETVTIDARGSAAAG